MEIYRIKVTKPDRFTRCYETFGHSGINWFCYAEDTPLTRWPNPRRRVESLYVDKVEPEEKGKTFYFLFDKKWSQRYSSFEFQLRIPEFYWYRYTRLNKEVRMDSHLIQKYLFPQKRFFLIGESQLMRKEPIKISGIPVRSPVKKILEEARTLFYDKTLSSRDKYGKILPLLHLTSDEQTKQVITPYLHHLSSEFKISHKQFVKEMSIIEERCQSFFELEFKQARKVCGGFM